MLSLTDDAPETEMKKFIDYCMPVKVPTQPVA